jgi:F-type H+-transporting ATPase subunit b
MSRDASAATFSISARAAATAADAAARAAARLIAERHDAGTDAKLVDQAIKEIAGR